MNVVDFQLNKTIPRKHTHDYVKNNSKPKQTKSRGGQRRAPVNSRKPNAPNQGGLVNLYFMGGRSDLNGATMIQLPQGIQQAIPLQQAQGIGAIPVPVPAIPIPPQPLAPGAALLNAPLNPLMPVLVDVRDAIRENRLEIDGIRRDIAANPLNQNLVATLTTRIADMRTDLQTEMQNLSVQQINYMDTSRNTLNGVIERNAVENRNAIQRVSDENQNRSAVNAQLVATRLEEVHGMSRTALLMNMPVEQGGKGAGGRAQRDFAEKIINEQSQQVNSIEERVLIASALKNIEQNKRKNPPKQKDISDSETDDDRFAAGSRRLVSEISRRQQRDMEQGKAQASRGPAVELSSRPSPTSINVSADLVGTSPAYRRRESTGGGDPRLPPLLGMPSISAFVDSDDSGGGNEIVYRSDAEFREDSKIVESDFDENYY